MGAFAILLPPNGSGGAKLVKTVRAFPFTTLFTYSTRFNVVVLRVVELPFKMLFMRCTSQPLICAHDCHVVVVGNAIPSRKMIFYDVNMFGARYVM